MARSKKFRKNTTRSRRNKYAGQYMTSVKTQFGTPIKPSDPSEEEKLETRHQKWLKKNPLPANPDKIYEKQFDIESQDKPVEPITSNDNDYGYYVDADKGGKRKRKRRKKTQVKRTRAGKRDNIIFV